MLEFSPNDELTLFDIPITEPVPRDDKADAHWDDNDPNEIKMKREFADMVSEASLALRAHGFTPHDDYRDLTALEELRHYGIVL